MEQKSTKSITKHQELPGSTTPRQIQSSNNFQSELQNRIRAAFAESPMQSRSPKQKLSIFRTQQEEVTGYRDRKSLLTCKLSFQCRPQELNPIRQLYALLKSVRGPVDRLASVLRKSR